MTTFPFQVIDWSTVAATVSAGTTGESQVQTVQLDGLRLRIVTYSAGYLADHWCQKGHIVHCLEGAFVTEEEGGGSTLLEQGMTYVVSDAMSSHRSFSEGGVKLLIIDGQFLGGSLEG